ncbi:hypothetical protein CRUP_034746 [Coryphaenoides rupestris]|nr:hypothetical protein CRUP_034746 [Coryphaenoides rupestris]
MLRATLGFLLLWTVLDATHSRGCSSFFCRKSRRVSNIPDGADPGKALFLTPYLEKGALDEARKLSLVGPLPGANVKSYAGYLTVNKEYNSNLYFWFFPAQARPETAPVLLWLQGGPGGTSMFGLFVEHGPYVVNKNMTVSFRDYPWTSRYSVIYIDNPVGTGFSFTDDDKGFAQNQDDVGRDLYSALTQFFQLFPEYQANDFYATGESYAGKYVPAISHYIHEHNPAAKVKINLKGMAIGDGLCDPELMLGGYAEFLYQTGLVDELQKQYVVEQTDIGTLLIQQQKWVEAFKEPADQEYFSQFVTLPEVRRSNPCVDVQWPAGCDRSRPLTERFLPTVNWSGAAEYKTAPRFPWKLQPGDSEVAGYVRQVGEFYQGWH